MNYDPALGLPVPVGLTMAHLRKTMNMLPTQEIWMNVMADMALHRNIRMGLMLTF